MIEWLVLGGFCAVLLFCIALNISVLYALTIGLGIFWLYGKHKGLTWKELAKLSLSGVKTVRNILITFVLIGILTALWRDAGTIPVIVCYASRLIWPPAFLLLAFLLNCGVSMLTGTSLGTAATMGVICATIASALNMNMILTGGAVLSGVYFGDRCSPVSTSALLVAELTGTNIFRNIRGMLRTACVPFLLSCGVFALMGAFSDHSGEVPDLQTMFGREFVLSWVALLPAAVILILSAMQINVKITMAVSILTALPISLFLQGTALRELPALMWSGFRPADPALDGMIRGGGITSMIRVGCIVCLSSAYSDIFRKTGLLNQAQRLIRRISERTNPYTAMLCTSVAASMIACNQTLATLLTHQLCDALEPDREKMALNLENTSIIVSVLIPWSIAGAVPLAAIGAPMISLGVSCFLYLLPLWRLVVEAVEAKRSAV